MKNVINAMILTEMGHAVSKVNGRRNYVIRMEMNDKRAYVGTMGAMVSHRLMSERLSYMAEHGTSWAEYTYKKDWQAAVNALAENGFSVKTIS